MRLNLTQHVCTPEQGCIEPADKAEVARLLTFDHLPVRWQIVERASELARIAQDAGAVEAMIGGAPYLMAPLEAELTLRGITPVYAFSVRESADQIQPDGSVRKVAVFRHLGFVRGGAEVAQ